RRRDPPGVGADHARSAGQRNTDGERRSQRCPLGSARRPGEPEHPPDAVAAAPRLARRLRAAHRLRHDPAERDDDPPGPRPGGASLNSIWESPGRITVKSLIRRGSLVTARWLVTWR